jgi:hypothetical protein
MLFVTRLAASAMVVLIATGSVGFAKGQDQNRKLLGTFHDWQAYTLTTGENKICYAISVPKKMAPKSIRRHGRTVKVQRGEVYITVTHRPATETENEVNVVAGYPFETNSQASYAIDGRKYTLFTMDDGAWAYDSKADNAIVTAMRRGKTLVVKGRSSHGTATTDTYSLTGFTAAHEAIDKACGVK